MTIQLSDAGKRFRNDWIFRGLTFDFTPGVRTALLGPNGSGKSTLMKVLSGHLSLSKGKIVFADQGAAIEPDQVWRKVSYAAPYIELIEELTLAEALTFHAQLRPFCNNMTPKDIYDLLELPRAHAKEIRFFSSGMKQRVKLAMAICADTPLLLIDEPTTNLDVNAVAWFHRLLDRFTDPARLIVIASNDPGDLELCSRQINIMDYK